MRIDAASLLLAAQIQPSKAISGQAPKAPAVPALQKPDAKAEGAKATESAQFQPLMFVSARSTGPAAQPASPVPFARPGFQLDIKV